RARRYRPGWSSVRALRYAARSASESVRMPRSPRLFAGWYGIDQYGAGGHGLHTALIDRKITPRRPQWRLAAERAPRGQLLGRHLQIQYMGIDIDPDAIAILDQPERAPDRRFRGDLGDCQALVAQPGELTVAHERDLVLQPCRIQGEYHGGGGPCHGGAPFGPHAAYDEHVARLDCTAADGLHGRGAVIEHQRRAVEPGLAPRIAQAQLDDGALRRQRAAQDGDGLLSGIGSLQRPDHLRVGHHCRGEIVLQRPSGHGEGALIQKRSQLLQQRACPAGRLEVLYAVWTVRAYGAQPGNPRSELVEEREHIERQACFHRGRLQMLDAV